MAKSKSTKGQTTIYKTFLTWRLYFLLQVHYSDIA